MEILVVRDRYTTTSVTGVMTLDGKSFGYTLEGPEDVRIPPGVYPILKTWSPKYNRYMPEIREVPGRRGIRIHAGNDATDTAGCILVGRWRALNWIWRSAPYAAWIEKEILRRIATEKVHITIR